MDKLKQLKKDLAYAKALCSDLIYSRATVDLITAWKAVEDLEKEIIKQQSKK